MELLSGITFNLVEEFEESEKKFEETKRVKMVEIDYNWGKDGNVLMITVRDDDLNALELAKIALKIYKKVKSV
ncbi:MAG: hypothetical protein QFX36_03700 [Archaeoglobales archaeon]|nr:hypothetical protein [Archaeoglobales archaeon]